MLRPTSPVSTAPVSNPPESKSKSKSGVRAKANTHPETRTQSSRASVTPATLTDYLQTAVIQVAPDFTIEYLNPAAEALLEVSSHRIVGTSVIPVLSAPHQLAVTKQALQRVQASGQGYTLRETALRIGGRDKWVDYTVSLIQDDPSSLLCQRLIIELLPIDRLMRISRDEHLNQQHQIARQLVRGVAHEIKNPLGGIRGATQLLARSMPNSSVQEYTDIIINEVDRLKTLADTMLGSRQWPDMQPVNVHEPLERVRQLLLAQYPDCIHLNIVRDYDLSLPDVTADRDQLIQIILNIAVNAMQAMTENPASMQGRQPTLTLRTRIQRMFTLNGVLNKSVIGIDIEDNGPGIPDDLLESLFYPLVTGRANGTGLGLSIAQDIMHQHGGLIECRSVPGCTVFSLYLKWDT